MMSGNFDHTSIIKTVWNFFDLSGDAGASSLTARDAAAPAIELAPAAVINGTGPFAGKIILTSAQTMIFKRQLDRSLPSQTLLAATPKGDPLTVTAASSNNHKGNPWLTVTPAGANIPNGWTVSVDDAHLFPGIKEGTITVSATGYTEMVVTVVMKVG